MFLSEFLYIIKRVLLSPMVIGIVIAALLYLQLVFYILNYSKKKNKPVEPVSKEKKEEADDEQNEDDSEEE